MVSALDVAEYILQQTGVVTTMKLQKLVYYCQAWSLVWDEKPMFKEDIEAWANGPVVRELYESHKGQFDVPKGFIGGDTSKLIDEQKETIDAVLTYYGLLTSQTLVNLTHAEDPWKDARKGIPETARSNNEISLASMAEYYGSLG
ncbi:MAG: DUF4065 domain-containing protein [Candidatus Thiodiazotropha sp. (ex Lucinoma kastoroae)]|nr:DUF4065 domain-containing protein [Candidatus Thiodiazotropha sp. (ex Rostrolucina anterorostrata)]MCU7850495.1 DUF4065 domain-containing protein [Candidatus Thiodiazotropha sp. (ex Lucinoma kastoroae)]